MKTALAAALFIALGTASGIALAQTSPQPGAASPVPDTNTQAQDEPHMDAMHDHGDHSGGDHSWGEHRDMRHGMHGRMWQGMGGRYEHMGHSKAASFTFRKGDASVSIKCADDEPTKACTDAASALLDKLAAQPK